MLSKAIRFSIEQPAEGKTAAKGSQDSNATLIIKSDNIVSSKEKEEILNELDGVLKNINELEDVDSSELNVQD